jgi:hypothetical protein
MAVMGLKPRSGIGQVFSHGYNRDNIIEDALKRLAQSSEVIQFANTEGWRRVKAEYVELMEQLKEYQLGLCAKANEKKVSKEIVRTHAFVQAMKLLLNITDEMIPQHERDNKTITRNKETAQRIAG